MSTSFSFSCGSYAAVYYVVFFSYTVYFIIDLASHSWGNSHWLFHDGGLYHIENSPLICRANQWTGFYMIGTSAMKELSKFFGK